MNFYTYKNILFIFYSFSSSKAYHESFIVKKQLSSHAERLPTCASVYQRFSSERSAVKLGQNRCECVLESGMVRVSEPHHTQQEERRQFRESLIFPVRKS